MNLSKCRLALCVGMAAMMSFTGCQTIGNWCGKKTEEPVKTVLVNGVWLKIQHLDHTDYNEEYKWVGKMPKVKYVTIHNTWNFAPAKNERAYLNRRDDKVHLSFQYAVDEKEAIELMGHRERGWHAGDGHGDGNYSSVAIEICRSRCVGKDEHLYREAEANGVRLAAWLLYRNNLTIKDLRKHQDWSGKNCPHRILDEKRWPEFKAAVEKSLAELTKRQESVKGKARAVADL